MMNIETESSTSDTKSFYCILHANKYRKSEVPKLFTHKIVGQETSDPLQWENTDRPIQKQTKMNNKKNFRNLI